jgi:DNA-binding transcriptional LysR family regulator
VLAEGAAAAREAHDGQRGRLTIGVLGSLAGCLLAPALAQFQRGHPRVECYVRAGSHPRMVELLCDGVVEAAEGHINRGNRVHHRSAGRGGAIENIA